MKQMKLRMGSIRLVLRRFLLALWSLLGPAPGWPGLKRWLLQVATLALLAGVGGSIFAVSGLASIKASSDHWPVTEWFLNFAMSRSVATHTLGVKAPALNARGMVLKGATHYEIGCFPCHGNPALPHPRIAREMTPHPPYLPRTIHEWKPEELFYIVKHGVKFTGMPAWPAQQRDDEVWAMVAFLQEFPKLNEQEYQRLVSGGEMMDRMDAPMHALWAAPEGMPRPVADNCERCHGVDGQGKGAGVFPKLAGQSRAYLEASLQAFARGERHSGIMEPIAAGLNEDEIREVARFYSSLSLPEPTSKPATSDKSVSRGQAIAHEGVLNQRIPICVECHGPGGNPRNPVYPTLAGQYADYLALQLELFTNDVRGGSEYVHLMDPIAHRLTVQQVQDLARYYESLAAPVAPQTP